ncbi:MAG: iron ABC transporter permease [Treponema sp.]|nr:iron ABC transporter permease [Treponema sp.]
MNRLEISAVELRKYRSLVLLIATGVLIFAILLGILIGTTRYSFGDLLSTIGEQHISTTAGRIIMNIRIPRILTGVLVGINLAIAGVMLQAMLRNPMASPNVIGVNSGAGLGAVIMMTLFPHSLTFIPLAAFAGAMITSILIYVISEIPGQSRTVHIVLAGVAISSLLKAVTSALMMLNSDILEITYSWLQGSLSGRGWNELTLIVPYTLVGSLGAIFISPKLNLFSLGDETASSLGLRIRLYRFLVMILSSVLAGSAISAAGTIGFIGLVAPHCARIVIGGDNRYLLPLSGIFGGILLVFSDMLARTVFKPVELSVGIVTAILGAPFFLWLLFGKAKR